MPRYPILLLLFLLPLSPAHAIITLGDEGRMLAPPSGAYQNSGFQFTGKWGSFVGTAIGPHHFITAGHVGGGVGDTFTLQDKQYTAEGLTFVKGTDLAVWRVKEQFPHWVELYDKQNETGKEIILYGRGCQRGRPFIYEGVMRGWLWGKSDDSLTWGRNRIDGHGAMLGSAEMLIFGFDRNSGDEESTVGRGDSGGGVFLQDGTTWKLAGVNHASGGQYARTKDGAEPFMAALYDTRGLYQSTGTGWRQHDPYATYPEPTLAFATRISTHASEIHAITGAGKSVSEIKPLSVRTGLMIVAGFLALIAVFIGIKFRRVSHAKMNQEEDPLAWGHEVTP